jgi:hypothetical protein
VRQWKVFRAKSDLGAVSYAFVHDCWFVIY